MSDDKPKNDERAVVIRVQVKGSYAGWLHWQAIREGRSKQAILQDALKMYHGLTRDEKTPDI